MVRCDKKIIRLSDVVADKSNQRPEFLEVIDLVSEKDGLVHVVGRTSESGGFVYHTVYDASTKKLVSDTYIKDNGYLVSFLLDLRKLEV